MASKILGSITQMDVATLTYRATSGLNECLYLAANEPSLGLYRIQEHVQSSVPRVVEQRQNLQQVATSSIANNVYYYKLPVNCTLPVDV